jgi:D-3-phosphoglycerate dehydrogenase
MKEKIKIDKIILDFDSTILDGELLEMIAEIAFANDPDKDKKVEEIAQITSLGMAGKITFRESLSCRLGLIDISQEILDKCIARTARLINPDYLRHIEFFSCRDTYVISGGYRNIINEVSDKINISKDRIYANDFIIENGFVSGVDLDNPLTDSDGKAQVARSIKSAGKTLMIGDGMTDYLVKEKGGADYFAAYTGIVNRPAVVERADFQLKSFGDLALFIE